MLGAGGSMFGSKKEKVKEEKAKGLNAG